MRHELLSEQDQEALERLIAEEVTQGLGPIERDELSLLLERASGYGEDHEGGSFDHPLLNEAFNAATAAEMAFLEEARASRTATSAEEMPASVEAGLRKLAEEEAKRMRQGRVVDYEDAMVYRDGLSPAWWLAAAAIFLALLGWWPRLSGRTERSPTPNSEQALERPADNQSARGEVERNLNDHSATISLTFVSPQEEASVRPLGEMLWNPILQRGEMHIVGLEPNDPSVTQYQLWIFDADRDQRFPVDGGVFDVPTGRAIVVPVMPAIPVRQATLFAVTVEPPGGVVVSDRERIVLVAQPS